MKTMETYEADLAYETPYSGLLEVPDERDQNYDIVLKLNDNLLAVQEFQQRGEDVPEGFLTRREQLLDRLSGETAAQILEEFRLRLHTLMRQAA